jgi:tetratricopeptide (TPR) repeat protein
MYRQTDHRYCPPYSEEAIKSCKQVVDTCNGLATAYLTQDNFQMAMELIKKAEALSEPYEFLRAVTYNNLACYYRRQNKLRTALKYLEKALALSGRHSDVVNRASTHLNLCAVLSQLGRHSVALEQAQSALILLQEQLFSMVLAPLRTGRAMPNLPELADKIAVLLALDVKVRLTPPCMFQ